MVPDGMMRVPLAIMGWGAFPLVFQRSKVDPIVKTDFYTPKCDDCPSFAWSYFTLSLTRSVGIRRSRTLLVSPPGSIRLGISRQGSALSGPSALILLGRRAVG